MRSPVPAILVVMGFHLAVDYRPRGDQATAIDQLVRGTVEGEKHQVLLGVTGSGKTFTMAKVMEKTGRPALVLAHNKTLAAQLYHEFKTFFPSNAVEYFVSYYDYYQPEAYLPSGDIYIEKEATINDELDKLRLSATRSLVRAARLRHRRQRQLHLRSRLARSVLRHAADARKGPEDFAPADHHAAGRDPVRPQRPQLQPRHVPRSRRRHRGLSDLRRLRLSHRAVRRRDRQPEPDRPVARPGPPDLPAPAHLPENALCHDAPGARAGAGQHRAGTRRVAAAARKAGQSGGGAAALPAHHVRSRNDPPDRLLPRHRELLAPFFRTPSRRSAADAARLSSARSHDLHRRKPPDHAATAGHVPRRSLAQDRAGQLRLPPAQRARQPAADVRRIREPRESGDVRFRDAGSIRADQVRRRRGGTDHPAHRPGGSASGSAPHQGSGGRSAQPDPPAGRTRTSACW